MAPPTSTRISARLKRVEEHSSAENVATKSHCWSNERQASSGLKSAMVEYIMMRDVNDSEASPDLTDQI